ncbi:MAG: cytochrome c3 family protein [Coriobacteriia bacterium]|nr:cytochrome c3 family protein [Coriobacteriia bacterium]
MFEGIRDIVRNLVDSLSTISLDELPERLSIIREAILDPRTNPLPFFIGLSILTIVALIIVISVVLAWLLLSRDRTNRLNYVLYDDEGEVIEKIPVEDAPEPLRSVQQIWAGRSLRFILTIAGIGALIASFGAATQSRTFCLACHEISGHTESVQDGDHAQLACTACHETGSFVQAYSTNAAMRLTHVAGGLARPDSDTGSYGMVTSASCLRCHEENIRIETAPSELSVIRMSHIEPLEAGMGCLVCHAFNEAQEIGLPDRGMEVCLNCHNDKTASATCTKCHLKHPLTVAKGAQWNYASHLLANTDPRRSCYRCHDPGPCDSCHGIRMPHPEEFIAMSSSGHPEHTRGLDVTVCFTCHDGSSTRGATDCFLCHARGSL